MLGFWGGVGVRLVFVAGFVLVFCVFFKQSEFFRTKALYSFYLIVYFRHHLVFTEP